MTASMGCAIVGVGETRYVRGSGVSTLHLGTECALNAIRDAGLTPQDVDGMILFTYMDPLKTYDLQMNLGIPELSWQLDVAGGGNNATGIITTAAAAVQAGLASTVLCLHAINRFSAPPGPQRRSEPDGAVRPARRPAELRPVGAAPHVRVRDY